MAAKAPNEITGLCIWLDAATITGKNNGDTVTSWSDQSGNSNDASEATNPPSYDDGSTYVEGAPGLLFDAVAERLTIGASASHDNSQATYIVIGRLLDVRQMSGNENSYYLNKRNTNPSTVSIVHTNQFSSGTMAWCRLSGSESTTRVLDTTSYWDSTMQLMAFRGKSGSQKFEIASLHGPLNLVEEQTTAADLGTGGTNDITIGRHPTSDNTVDRDRIIYQVIAYDNYISDADLASLVEWFQAVKYTNRWVEQAQMFGTTGIYGVNIFIDGSTAYLAYVKTDDVSIGYMTASLSDPHNWTDQGTIFTAPDATRKARLVKYGSTWYLYYDGRLAGTIRVATGSTPATLSDYGSNPILSGSGTDWEQYVRHPFVLTPNETHDTGWHMLYDGRKTTSTSGQGAVGHATSSDGLSWTRDTANNPVLSPTSVTSDGDYSDCAEPTAWYDTSAGQYRVFWAGYNNLISGRFVHYVQEGYSSTLTSVTRIASGANASQILPLSADDVSDKNTESIQSFCAYPTGDGNMSGYYTGFNQALTYRAYRALYSGGGPGGETWSPRTVMMF